MTIGEKLKGYRISNQLTATEIAARLGISKSTISNYEKGIRQPGIDMIKKLAYIFGVSVEDLIVENDIMSTTPKATRQIPILGGINKGGNICSEENIIGYTDLGSDYFGKGDYFAMYIRGDSMNEARICDGDIIIVKKQDDVENGCIAVVQEEGEEAVVRRVFKKESFVTLIPSSSSNYATRTVEASCVKILGRVVEVKIKL